MPCSFPNFLPADTITPELFEIGGTRSLPYFLLKLGTGGDPELFAYCHNVFRTLCVKQYFLLRDNEAELQEPLRQKHAWRVLNAGKRCRLASLDCSRAYFILPNNPEQQQIKSTPSMDLVCNNTGITHNPVLQQVERIQYATAMPHVLLY